MKDIVVLYYKGFSYLHLEDYSEVDPEKWLVNNQKPTPGSLRGWGYVEGKVTSLQLEEVKSGAFIGWQVADSMSDAATALGLANTMPTDAIHLDSDDCLVSEYPHPEFYRRVYGEREVVWQHVNFVEVNMDTPPVEIALRVRFTTPDHIRDYRELWHLYPCVMDVPEVYNYVDEKVKAAVAQSGGRLSADNFNKIQTTTVREWVRYPYHVEEPRNVASFSAKKPRYKNFPVEGRWIDVLKYVGTYRPGQGSADVIQIRDVKGENYLGLVKNLDEYTQTFLDAISAPRHEFCPTCRGTGIRECDP